MKGKKLVWQLLKIGQGKGSLAAAVLSMGTGVVLLLLAIQSYINVNQLLYGPANKTGMTGFLIINKMITARTMGFQEKNTFSPEEINGLKQQPFIKGVGVITSNQFAVNASAGNQLQLNTELFFEAVPDSFLDNQPEDWSWQPGSRVLPVILSTDFLNLYNYGFALSRGLPQLSAASVKAVSFTVTISNGLKSEDFQANIVGFSDRISSVLVPESFMDWANATFQTGAAHPFAPSRLILKVTDPSSPTLAKYLQENHYETNQDRLGFSKARLIIQAVITAIGIFGTIILILAIVIFSIYLQLMIARAKDEIQLLVALGYSPAILGKFLLKRLMRLCITLLLTGVLIVSILQWVAAYLLQQHNLALNSLISLAVAGCAILILLIFYLIISGSIRKQMDIITS